MSRAMLHLSIPIKDIGSSLDFYRGVLGCEATRIQDDRIDFHFFGHHLVAQLSPEECRHKSVNIGADQYPLRHFGVIVESTDYDRMLAKLISANSPFAMHSKKIFVGTPREQSVCIVYDPSGNAVEIKGIPDPQQVFSSR